VPPGSILLPQDPVNRKIWWLRGARSRTICWEGLALLKVTTTGIRLDTAVAPSLVLPEVLNPALALMLAGRGYMILHGGAIGLRDCCALIVGPPGAGKSSLILSAARRGREVLSDEIVPVRGGPAGLYCPGGNRYIRVDPRLLGAEARSHGVAAAAGKVQVDVRAMGCRVAERRRRIVLVVQLGARFHAGPDPFRVAPLREADSLTDLIEHTYNRRTMNDAERRRHLRVCARLARTVPAYRLAVREGIGNIDEASRGLDELLSSSARMMGL
jgi:hypothetical protein